MLRCRFCAEENACPYYPAFKDAEEAPPCFEKGEKFRLDWRKGLRTCWPDVAAFLIRCAICLLFIAITAFGPHGVSVLCAVGIALLWPMPDRLEKKKSPADAGTSDGAGS